MADNATDDRGTGINVGVDLLVARFALTADARKVDSAFLEATGRVHELIRSKLGTDPAFERLQLEAREKTGVRDRTKARVAMALEDMTEEDAQFASALREAIFRARAAAKTDDIQSTDRGTVTNSITGNVSGRVVQARDINGGVSF